MLLRRLAPLALMVLLAAPAAARMPDWSCPAAVRTWCEAGQPCQREQVSPFVLVLHASQGTVEICEGEYCAEGELTEVAPIPFDAAGLLLGWAALAPSPPPAALMVRNYAVMLDRNGRSVSLSRVADGIIEVLQAGDCAPRP